MFSVATACSPGHGGGLVDQVGHPVAAGTARSIVALAPDVTELAFAVGAGASVIATAATADHPAAVSSLRRIDPNDVESILSQRPDLVLATTAGNDPRVVDRLRDLGVRVCTCDVTSFPALVQAISLVGAVTGHTSDAEALAAATAQRVGAVSDRARALPRRRALYVVWWDPLIVAAPGTFHDDMLRTAALDNIAPAVTGRYPRVDPEVLLDPDLETVVAPDEADGRALFAAVVARPVAARLRSGAVRVVWLPGDLASRPGPRVVTALELLLADRIASP